MLPSLSPRHVQSIAVIDHRPALHAPSPRHACFLVASSSTASDPQDHQRRFWFLFSHLHFLHLHRFCSSDFTAVFRDQE